VVARGPEEFDDKPLGVTNRLRVGPDDHAAVYRHAAGRDQRSCLFHFHDADAAGADVRRPLIVTEGRYEDPVRPGDIQDRLTGLGFIVFAVDIHRYLVVHSS